MSSSNGRDRHVDELMVVYVEDEINRALAGHDGVRYESPPQPRKQAQELARVLLGYTSNELKGGERRTCPIAGGRRTVALKPTTGSGH